MAPKKLVDRGLLCAGNPDSCIKVLERFEQLGVDLILCFMEMGRVPHTKTMESIKMFGKYVSHTSRPHELVHLASPWRVSSTGCQIRPRAKRALRPKGAATTTGPSVDRNRGLIPLEFFRLGEPSLAEQVIDQGRLWWPSGLPGQETAQIFFNLAQTERPGALKLEDYDSREPFDVDVEFEQQGTGKWARWTAATIRFKKPEQRGRSFRWTLTR